MEAVRAIGSERGSAAILVAIVLAALVGCAALSLDAGQLYIQRAELVNALDSAVLAGCQYLPQQPDLALQTAGEYAQINGLRSGEAVFKIGENNRTISGQAIRAVPFRFAHCLGFPWGEVSAEAGARVVPVSAVRGVAPFGVIEDDYQFGETVMLKEGSGDTLFSGWFGALRLGEGGAGRYEENIIKGYAGVIEIGDVVPIEAGNMSTPTRRGIAYCIDQCNHVPRCSISQYDRQCSRILVVPLVRIAGINAGGHPDQVKVVGFAAFLVSRYAGNGNDNEVEGSFIQHVTCGEAGTDAVDHGLYCAQLYK